MPKFKIEVSKNQKKYNLVIDSTSMIEARNRVHNEWYSVLNIIEFNETLAQWEKFYFTIEDQWKRKSWTIHGSDIFKVYLKLKKELGYTIIALYKNKEDSEEKKQNLIKNLDDAYNIYLKNQSKKQKKSAKIAKDEKKEETIDDFYMKKELETTYKLVEFVIDKIKYVLDSKNFWKIDPEKRKKIEKVYESIIQIKGSTNVSKLKEIWELALIRIWELELELVEKEKNIYAKQFLKETNKLLKRIWSDKHFIEKDKDIKAKIKLYIEKAHEIYKDFKRARKQSKKQNTDKTSYDYLKTVALLNRYKEKYRQVQVERIKNFWHFLVPDKKEQFEKLLLTKAVLRQNIIIMKAKRSWKIYSYTKIVKWYEKLFEILRKSFIWLNRYLFAVVSVFSSIFIFFIVFKYYFVSNSSGLSFNYYGIYYIILMTLFILMTKIIKWFWSLSFVFITLFWIIIFAWVNF